MRKVLTVLAALAAFGATSAIAAEMGMTEKTTGTIESINQAKDQLTLQNGKTFTVIKNVNLKKMTPGEKVAITYTQSGKARAAMEVKAAS
jgi:hypothetical protein